MTDDREREVQDALPQVVPPWLVSGAALMAEPEPPPPAIAWHLDEGGAVLHEGRRYLMVGDASVGKSLLALAACIEIAHGGRDAVYLDWEDSLRTFRVRRKVLRVGLTEYELSASDAERLHYGNLVSERWTPDLQLPEECALIVIDSLSRAMGAAGLDENSASDLNRFVADVIEPLRRMAPEAALLVLDHPGHADGTRPRGSSAKRPAVDVALTLERAGARGLKIVNRKDRHADMDVPVGGTVAEVRILPGEGRA